MNLYYFVDMLSYCLDFLQITAHYCKYTYFSEHTNDGNKKK